MHACATYCLKHTAHGPSRLIEPAELIGRAQTCRGACMIELYVTARFMKMACGMLYTEL